MSRKPIVYSSPNELDGRLPMRLAFPFGLQHVLAMFVGNLSPLLIIMAMCGIGPWLMAQGYSSPTWAMICGLTYTLLMVAVTCFFTRKKLFWRS